MDDSRIDSSAYIEVHTLAPNHCNTVNTLSFSPDGTYLASGGDDLTLNIWNVMQGRLLYRILFEAAISCLVWHPLYPDTVIAACDDGRIFQLHDFMPMGCAQTEIRIGVLGETHALTYGARTGFLAVAIGDQVHITREPEQNKYDVSILLPPPTRGDMDDESPCAVSLYFSGQGHSLIVAYLAHGIVCYDVNTRQSLWKICLNPESPNIGSAALSADERYIIIHNISGSVDIYAIGGRKNKAVNRYTFDEPPRSKHCLQVAFVQRCHGVVCGTTTGNICIWYKSSGEIFQKLPHNGQTIQAVAVSERESMSYIATGSVETGLSAQIKIWRARMNGSRKPTGNATFEHTVFNLWETVTFKRLHSRRCGGQGFVISGTIMFSLLLFAVLLWGYIQDRWLSIMRGITAAETATTSTVVVNYIAALRHARAIRSVTYAWARVVCERLLVWLEDKP